ncbi:MAG: hydrogenase maturation protease [Ignavibacteriales bacterium]|nr:hydrogenase maturation protease [Ignavibacteriales bacterium]
MNFNDFKNLLSKYHSAKILFLGLGNELRGDDAAGLVFFDLLKKKNIYPTDNFIYACTNPENYLQKILDFSPDCVVFLDAVIADKRPGEIFILESEIIDKVKISTHSYSIKLIEEYLKMHQNIDFVYIGIQPLGVSLENELSDIVKRNIEKFFSN